MHMNIEEERYLHVAVSQCREIMKALHEFSEASRDGSTQDRTGIQTLCKPRKIARWWLTSIWFALLSFVLKSASWVCAEDRTASSVDGCWVVCPAAHCTSANLPLLFFAEGVEVDLLRMAFLMATWEVGADWRGTLRGANRRDLELSFLISLDLEPELGFNSGYEIAIKTQVDEWEVRCDH